VKPAIDDLSLVASGSFQYEGGKKKGGKGEGSRFGLISVGGDEAKNPLPAHRNKGRGKGRRCASSENSPSPARLAETTLISPTGSVFYWRPSLTIILMLPGGGKKGEGKRKKKWGGWRSLSITLIHGPRP